MFQVGVAALGAGSARAGLGTSTEVAQPAAAIAPGARMQSAGGQRNPLAPTHPAGIAFWVGVGAVVIYIGLWYSLPA